MNNPPKAWDPVGRMQMPWEKIHEVAADLLGRDICLSVCPIFFIP